ncbi:NAD(P)-binding protein [Hymenopellis radicata]|nr:NAD(P)-binding protein [Hymenopellis radicata]
MSSSAKVYRVTGANRGIGFALNADKDIAVIAAVRDISSQSFTNICGKYPGKIHAMKYVANNQALAKEIKAKFGRVDTVVSCAAIGNNLATILETPLEEFEDHFPANAVGVVVLFQTLYGLLKSSKAPKFIPISSVAGSLTASMSLPATANTYGVSKAALDYIARRTHFENDRLVCFPLDPGPVDTDMSRLIRALDKSGSVGAILNAHANTTEAAATKL